MRPRLFSYFLSEIVCQGFKIFTRSGKKKYRLQTLYGWAKGAPPMQLPDGVGYSVGAGSKINSLVLQASLACCDAQDL